MTKRLAVVEIERCVGCQSCMFACARRAGEGGLSAACIGVRSAGGFRKGFVVIVCRACPDPPCARVCPVDAITVQQGVGNGGVRVRMDLCIGCGNCMEACPFGAVFWDDEENKPQICVHCGYCAPYCPYDVLGMEEIEPAKAAEEVAHAAQ